MPTTDQKTLSRNCDGTGQLRSGTYHAIAGSFAGSFDHFAAIAPTPLSIAPKRPCRKAPSVYEGDRDAPYFIRSTRQPDQANPSADTPIPTAVGANPRHQIRLAAPGEGSHPYVNYAPPFMIELLWALGTAALVLAVLLPWSGATV